jgi:hypothetical protein
MMQRSLIATAAIVALGISFNPTSASGHWRGGWGWGVGAGVLAGALIGGALARSYYYPPGYYYGPVYNYGPRYYYGPQPYSDDAPPVYVAPHSSYTGRSDGGYYYGPADQCWPCY